MVAEQVTRSRYWAASGLARDIRIVARVEVPGEPGVDVDTVLSFPETFAHPWDELIASQLYAGVHAGLAAVGSPLPDVGIRVVITEFAISPPLPGAPSPTEQRAIEATIRALAASTVEALCTGLSHPETIAEANGSPR